MSDRHHTYPNTRETAGGRGADESTFDRAKPIALGLILAALAVAGLASSSSSSTSSSSCPRRSRRSAVPASHRTGTPSCAAGAAVALVRSPRRRS